MTKLIIVVKFPCKISFLYRNTKSFISLISDVLVAYNKIITLLLIGLTLFLQPGCFCLGINYMLTLML